MIMTLPLQHRMSSFWGHRARDILDAAQLLRLVRLTVAAAQPPLRALTTAPQVVGAFLTPHVAVCSLSLRACSASSCLHLALQYADCHPPDKQVENRTRCEALV